MADVTLRAETELAAAKAELESLKQALADVGEETEQEQQKNEGLNVGLANLMMGMSVAKMSVDMLGQAYNATLGVYMDYAKQVRDITAATGLQTEEVSRMIEVADDAGVEIGTLKAALREMGKDGVAPTVDELANLADKFKLIQDPALRTQFLMESFGRAGLEMGKLMEQSGESIRSASAVMDQEMAVKARALEVAIDGLADATRNELIKAVDSLIPVLTDAANTLELLFTWNNRLKAATEDHEASVIKSADSYAAYVTEMRRSTLAAQGLNEAEIAERQGLDQLYGSIEETARSLKLKNQAEFDAARGVKDYAARLAEATVAQKEQAKSEVDLAYDVQQGNNALADRYQAMGAQYQQTGPLTDAQERLTNSLIAQRYAGYAAADATRDQATAEAQAAEATSQYRAALGGAVTGELTSFKNKQDELKTKSQELQGEIDKLTAKPWLSEAQRAQLDELKAKLGDNQQAVKDNAAEHELATKKIMLGYLEQRLAMGGLTTDEQNALMEVANRWGLVDDASLTAYKDITAAADKFNTGGSLSTLKSDLDAAKTKAEGVGATATKHLSDTKTTIDAAGSAFAASQERGKSAQTAVTNLANDPGWQKIDTNAATNKTSVANLQTAQETQATVAATKLEAQAIDPNWNVLQDQVAATESAFSSLAYTIRSMPDHKTIIITTRYVTEGIPTAVAASAGP